MKTPTVPVAGLEPEHSILFEIIRTPSGWRIDEDGRPYGAYVEEEQAVTAARAAAMVLINAGGKAAISYGPVDQDKE